MPLLTIGDSRRYYRIDGTDDRPVLMLSHSLGLDHGMWDPQATDLLPHFRIVRYDIRGHGASDVSDGDYTIEQLGTDVLALADALDIRTFAFCGLSLGGMIGQWLAANAGDRLTHLVLANTTYRVTDPSSMEQRRVQVLQGGMAAVADMVMGRFFSARSLAQNSPGVAAARRVLLTTHPRGYAGCCAAIRDMDLRASLETMHTPTLVISGEDDVGMPWPGHGQVLSSAIPGATSIRLPAAHLSNIEQPRSFSAALLKFLLPAVTDPLDSGFAVRRAVLGDAYVDRAIADTTDLTQEFQDLITKYAWGTIWTRPGLDRRSRRMLALVMLATLGRWDEFRAHVRTGLAAELEPCDIKEILLQTAIYAGVPSANAGFTIAQEELQSLITNRRITDH